MALDFDVDYDDELAPKVTIQGAMDIDNDDEVAAEVTIQWNLKMFLPYICDCVSATDLLTFLHFYTKEQRKEIFQLSTSQPHTATKKALEILWDNVQEPGRFTALKECMDFCKYPKISEILLGKHVPDDLNYQRIVDLFSSELIGRLQPSELLPLLRRYEVVQLEECDQIRAEEMNNGSRRACWLMLYYLPCRHKNWFKYFLRTLIECNFGDLAEKLDPDLYEKLVAQERSEEGASGCTADESMSLVYGAGQSKSILVITDSVPPSGDEEYYSTIDEAAIHDINQSSKNRPKKPTFKPAPPTSTPLQYAVPDKKDDKASKKAKAKVPTPQPCPVTKKERGRLGSDYDYDGTDRTEVEGILTQRPEGTFLVRKSRQDDKRVLSVNVGGALKEFKIFNKEEGKITLDNVDYFTSLEELIANYKKNNLPKKTTSLYRPYSPKEKDE